MVRMYAAKKDLYFSNFAMLYNFESITDKLDTNFIALAALLKFAVKQFSLKFIVEYIVTHLCASGLQYASILTVSDKEHLLALYKRCVESLREFRSYHLQIVAKYVCLYIYIYMFAGVFYLFFIKYCVHIHIHITSVKVI